jgi:PAS domain S-box-containing protein
MKNPPNEAELEIRVLQRTSELAAANTALQEQMQRHIRAERAYQEIMDNSIDVICTFDLEGKFLWVNRACERLWGYKPEELIGRPFMEMVHADDRERTIAIDQSILNGMSETGFENRYLRKDGTVVWIVWTANWSEALQINVCVARDMTPRKQLEIELLRAREAAEAANLAKSEFLASMSHELRTPLNSILGFTGTLLMRLPGPLNSGQQKQLETIKASAKHQLSLINDLLDLAKIESGKVELNLEWVACRGVLEEIMQTLRPLAAGKGLNFDLQLPEEGEVVLRTDRRALSQILINLINNAIKFTDQGAVELSLRKIDDTVEIVVTDTGVGIKPEDQVKLFAAFTRLNGRISPRTEGAGLGLHLSQKLAALLGGRIQFESVPGKGSMFSLAIPQRE